MLVFLPVYSLTELTTCAGELTPSKHSHPGTGTRPSVTFPRDKEQTLNAFKYRTTLIRELNSPTQLLPQTQQQNFILAGEVFIFKAAHTYLNFK